MIRHLGYWDTYPLGYSWDFPFHQVFYISVERKKAAAACLFQKTGQASTSLSSKKALLQAEAMTGGFWARVGAAQSAFPHSPPPPLGESLGKEKANTVWPH